MHRYSCFTLLYGMALFGTGCLVDMHDTIDEATPIDTVALQARVSNDTILNGTEANGAALNGWRLNGWRLNGWRLNGLTLGNTSFTATKESDGSTLSGLDLLGSELEGELEGGGIVPLRIAAIIPSSTLGLNYYTVEYLNNGTWTNVCWNGAQAIPLSGQWDETSGDHLSDSSRFTFACRGAALAKCAEWGYQHFKTRTECKGGTCKEHALEDFHQACTRMVRADYCGDGVAHTENGTSINIWDALGIQTQDLGTGMSFEAEWTTDGAACVKHTRWANSVSDNPSRDYILAYCPERWVGPSSTSCGGTTSTFHTASGFDIPLAVRRLLRNESYQNYHY